MDDDVLCQRERERCSSSYYITEMTVEPGRGGRREEEKEEGTEGGQGE